MLCDMLSMGYDKEAARGGRHARAVVFLAVGSAQNTKRSGMIIASTALLVEVSSALGLTQAGLGKILGCSSRTIQRWQVASAFSLLPEQAQSLAREVYPHDATLAAKVAAVGGGTLESFGIARPARAPTATHLVDSLVCAAAEASTLHPREMRPALIAAFTRAYEMGLTIEAVQSALQPEPTKAKGAARK
jgi:hypothetical protein